MNSFFVGYFFSSTTNLCLFLKGKKKKKKHCPSSKYIRGSNISRMSRDLSFRNHEQFHVRIRFLAMLETSRERERRGRPEVGERERRKLREEHYAGNASIVDAFFASIPVLPGKVIERVGESGNGGGGT